MPRHVLGEVFDRHAERLWGLVQIFGYDKRNVLSLRISYAQNLFIGLYCGALVNKLLTEVLFPNLQLVVITDHQLFFVFTFFVVVFFVLVMKMGLFWAHYRIFSQVRHFRIKPELDLPPSSFLFLNHLCHRQITIACISFLNITF